jgi:PEP-CTERM motif
LGGSILLANRFLLSLVAALFLSALAAADSTNVTAAFLHSGAGANGGANPQFSTNSGKASPATFGVYNGHVSAGANGNARIGGAFSGTASDSRAFTGYKIGQIAPPGGMHGTRFKNDKWNATGQGRGLTTPEPSSLMLLSTGLMGIAGMARRKLRLG